MIKRYLIICCASLVAFGGTTSLLAEPIRIDWTGQIRTDLPVPPGLTGQFALEDVATVSFTYDSGATDTAPDANGFWLISDYDINIGSYSAIAPGGEFEFLSGLNRLTARTATIYGLDGPDIPSPEPPDSLLVANLTIFSPTITSDRLPLPGEAASIVSGFSLTFDGPNGFENLLLDQISIDITAFDLPNPSPVPVPAAIWLFGTALLGLVGFSKRSILISPS